MRPFITWNGNKSRQLKSIIPLIPKSFNTFYEPFCGSGAVSLALKYHKTVISDIDDDLINTWKQIKSNPNKIIELISQYSDEFIPLSNKHKLSYLQDKHDKMKLKRYSVERSALHLFLTKNSRFGLTSGSNNNKIHSLNPRTFIANDHPYTKPRFNDNLLSVSKFLKSTTILKSDYKKIFKIAKSGDFIFIDPPYNDRDYKFKYDASPNNTPITELVDELKILDTKGIKWMMTYADSPEIRNAFKDKNFNITTTVIHRNIHNTYNNELIIRNYS